MTVLSRLAKLEERRRRHACTVCRGRPPTEVTYLPHDPYEREHEPVAPCPGCGGIVRYQVRYVDNWREHGDAA